MTKYLRQAALISSFIGVILCLLPSLASSRIEAKKGIKEGEKLKAECLDACNRNDYTRAIKTCQEYLEMNEEFFGPDDPTTAVVMNLVAMLYLEVGDYQQAEPLLKKALEINEKCYGPENQITAMSQTMLASLYSELSDYEQAESFYLKALKTYEKVLGPDHPDTASCLCDLGSMYSSMGDLARAEPMLKKGLAIDEKELGSENLETVGCMSSLGMLYLGKGDFSRAESFLKKSLAIEEKIAGPENPDTASALTKLGMMYSGMDDYASAEPLFKRALDIYEKSFGPENPRTALAMTNLATLYEFMDDSSRRAEPLYQRALTINEKVFGQDNLATVMVQAMLGCHYLLENDYTRAEPLLQLAFDFYEKTFGPEHPYTMSSLNNLTLLYYFMGDYSRAEPLFNKALEINERTRGPEHPDTARLQTSLALTKFQVGKEDLAFTLIEKAFAGYMKKAENIFSFANEAQRMSSQEDINSSLGDLLSMAVAWPSKETSRRSAYDAVVRSKGIILEALLGEREAVRAAFDPELQKVFEELKDTNNQIAALYAKGPGNNPAEYRKLIDDLTKRSEELEGKLARGSADFRAERERNKAGYEEVCKAIPAGTALVDYVYFDKLEKRNTPGEDKWTPWLVAFVVEGGKCNAPAMVDLGPAEPIEGKVKTWRQLLQSIIKGQAGIDATSKAELMARGEELRKLIWDAIKAKLPKGVKRITIAPDGPLHLVSFAALPEGQDKYLIEAYDLDYVTAAKDFLPRSAPAHTGPALLLGGPDFNLGQGSAVARNDDGTRTRGLRGECPNLQNLHYDALPASAQEVKEIGDEFKGKGSKEIVVIGAEATEERFKAAAKEAPILHLATHGFFLAGDCAAAQATTGVKPRGAMMERNGGMLSLADSGPPTAARVNPLLVSGLALAGANHADKYAGENDGVLLALEIANMDLRGVKLVTLSACDTGLGEVKLGEGVFGLKRSFIMAGAEGLVVSLWSVPDEPTRDLMSRFYAQVLQGVDPGTALRQAQLDMIASAHTAKTSDHPILWAAFQYVK